MKCGFCGATGEKVDRLQHTQTECIDKLVIRVEKAEAECTALREACEAHHSAHARAVNARDIEQRRAERTEARVAELEAEMRRAEVALRSQNIDPSLAARDILDRALERGRTGPSVSTSQGGTNAESGNDMGASSDDRDRALHVRPSTEHALSDESEQPVCRLPVQEARGTNTTPDRTEVEDVSGLRSSNASSAARQLCDGCNAPMPGPHLAGEPVCRVTTTTEERSNCTDRTVHEAPLTGPQLAARHGFRPHGLDPAQAMGAPQAIDIPCPYCKARPGEICRDENDGSPTAHESREPEQRSNDVRAETRTLSGMGRAMRALLQAVASGTMPVEAAWISVMREIDSSPSAQRTDRVTAAAGEEWWFVFDNENDREPLAHALRSYAEAEVVAMKAGGTFPNARIEGPFVKSPRADKASPIESFAIGDVVSLHGVGEHEVIDVKDGWVRTSDLPGSTNHWHNVKTGHVTLVRPTVRVEESELLRQLVKRYSSLGEIPEVVENDFRRVITWARRDASRVDYPTSKDDLPSLVAWMRAYSESQDDYAHPLWEYGHMTEREAGALAHVLEQRPWLDAPGTANPRVK